MANIRLLSFFIVRTQFILSRSAASAGRRYEASIGNGFHELLKWDSQFGSHLNRCHAGSTLLLESDGLRKLICEVSTQRCAALHS